MVIKTILVEDNEKIRTNLIPAMRELAGLEIIAVAETQAEAGEALERYSDVWQLVIIDLFLREGSGLGVLRNCKYRRSDQLAVVLTHYPNIEIQRQCVELGADDLFDKSMELNELFEKCIAVEPRAKDVQRRLWRHRCLCIRWRYLRFVCWWG